MNKTRLISIVSTSKNVVLNSDQFKKRKRLNGGTVPPFKMHPGGTVPPFKMHPGGTVPPFKMHPGGTVPPFKMHPGGTLNFYELFFELEFGLWSKNNWLLVASVFEFELFKSFFPTPSPFSCWSCSDVAFMLILEGQSLHLKCSLSFGTIHW